MVLIIHPISAQEIYGKILRFLAIYLKYQNNNTIVLYIMYNNTPTQCIVLCIFC